MILRFSLQFNDITSTFLITVLKLICTKINHDQRALPRKPAVFFGGSANEIQVLGLVHGHCLVDITLGVNVGPQGSLHGQAEHVVLVGNVCVAFLTA